LTISVRIPTIGGLKQRFLMQDVTGIEFDFSSAVIASTLKFRIYEIPIDVNYGGEMRI